MAALSRARFSNDELVVRHRDPVSRVRSSPPGSKDRRAAIRVARAALCVDTAGLARAIVQARSAADHNAILRESVLHELVAMDVAVDQHSIDAVQRLQRVAGDAAVHEHRGGNAAEPGHATAGAAFDGQVIAHDQQPGAERIERGVGIGDRFAHQRQQLDNRASHDGFEVVTADNPGDSPATKPG